MFLDFLRTYQVHILIGCGITCMLLAFFVTVIKFHSTRKKLALLKIQMGVAILSFSNAQYYIYEGDLTSFGYWMVRISNFLVFTLVLANIYFLTEYVTALFMETGKFEKLPKRLLWGFILPIIGMNLVLVSQFTGIYYWIDKSNVYHRGPLYSLGFIIPFVAVNLLFTFVLQYRKSINKRLVWAIILYSLIPIGAAVIQLIWYGISFINLATWLAAVVLFWFALSDQNDELSKAANTELVTGLPNAYGFMYEVDRLNHYQNITEYNAYYFDIVRMGNYNSKYGKKTGDEIIVKYAKAIHSFLEKEEILGRLGGNFFVALVKKNRTEEFLQLLSDTPVEIEIEDMKETIHVSAVAGVYEINRKNLPAGIILGYISSAVTYAKTVAHKPYVFMDESLEKEFERIRILEEDVKKGLKNGEFLPFYQPKVDTLGNVLCGAEALVRWKHNGKLVSPGQFIPVIQNNGYICNMDFYILEYVCQDIRR